MEWCRERGVLALIADTATGATDVDPWGREIQAVYRDLRLMLEACPQLAIVLIVHCKKPQGRGGRRISDVLGEWGRWCDVVVLQERAGASRVRLTTFKRIRHMRRIVATQRGGLLVDPKDIATDTGPKVPLEQVVAVIQAEPGLTQTQLPARLKVSKRTVSEYVAAAVAEGLAHVEASGPRGAFQVFPRAQDQPRNRAMLCNEMPARSGPRAVENGTAQPRNHLYRLRGAFRAVAQSSDVPSDGSDGCRCGECGQVLGPDEIELCTACYDPAGLDGAVVTPSLQRELEQACALLKEAADF